ncbi:hypothetical protein [Kitasatospora sp. NPDC001132]
MQDTTQPILARYLTVAGSGTHNASLTVDIINESLTRGALRIICWGCTWTDHHYTNSLYSDSQDEATQRITTTLPAARKSAQEHAETCRAMPADA